MDFTQAEAKAKLGEWVRVRDATGLSEHMTAGTVGQVVDAHLHQRAEGPGHEDIWVVCLLLYLSPDHSVRLLLHDISKGQYIGCVEEIPGEREPENRGSRKDSQPLQPALSPNAR